MQEKYIPDLLGFQNYLSISKSEHTIYGYGKYIRYFFDYFNEPPENIKKQIIIKYFQKLMSENKSPVNFKITIYALKSYFKFLNNTKENSNLDLRVFEDIEKPRETFTVQKVVAFSDIKKIIKYLKKTKNRFVRIRSIMIVLIFATTGARKREVANIKLINVDVDSGFIRFIKTKSNNPRVNPIPKVTVKYIKKYLALREEIADTKNDNLIVSIYSKNKKYETLGIVQALYNKIKKKFSNFTLHAIRRGYATDLYNNGVELAKVSKALGHASFSTTVRYYLLFKDKDLEKAISLHPAYSVKHRKNKKRKHSKVNVVDFRELVKDRKEK